MAAAGLLSSRSRAIHNTRFETLGKSTVQSTREAASARARPASSRVSPERSSVFDGMQPQYGHSPPTSSRSTTASVRPLSRSPSAIASPATPPPRHTTSNCSDKVDVSKNRLDHKEASGVNHRRLLMEATYLIHTR